MWFSCAVRPGRRDCKTLPYHTETLLFFLWRRTISPNLQRRQLWGQVLIIKPSSKGVRQSLSFRHGAKRFVCLTGSLFCEVNLISYLPSFPFSAARALGADSTVDFRRESYSEALQDFSAVIDTLGREKEGAQNMLKEVTGASYFSLQPSILKVRKCVRRNAVLGSFAMYPGVGIQVE